ncbi:DUF2651 family protein [Salibacterium aidingense]|uniref:DUF2651 family protein n=1 Tax=Salibacterium aidingense TaxID=384933 RepID=UPI0004288FA0|nr:DUF2651 family protein [Salibacterium aidingense]
MNTIVQVIVVFPAVSLVAGILGRVLLKNLFIMPGVVFIVAFSGILVWYNSTFSVWMIFYTLLAFLAGYLVDLFVTVRTWMKSGKRKGT